MATSSAIEAFEKQSRRITATHDLKFTDGGSVGAALKSVTGGKISMTRAEVVVAEGHHGPEVAVQPYAGNTPLPGELHAIVPGALRAQAAYDDSGFLGFNWNSEDDELRQYLRSNKFGAHGLPEHLKHGLTKIDLGWTVQVAALATDQSVIACQLGGFSGLGAHESALGVIDQLAAAIRLSAASGPQPTAHPLRLRQLAELAITDQLDQLQSSAAPVEHPTLDPGVVRGRVAEALTPDVSKRVIVGLPEDPKKLSNITKKIAPDIDPTDICAFVDTGIRASGKSGAVFTPTSIFIAELGDNYRFDYGSIQSFRLDDSELSIHGADGSTVKIASHGEAAIITRALAAATGRVG